MGSYNICSIKKWTKTGQISLEGNPTTGCSWEYSIKTNGIIKEDSNEYKPENTGLVGSGGIYTWKFSALDGIMQLMQTNTLLVKSC